MAPTRYELTEAQWRRVELLLPGRAGTVGRPAEDNRRFVNAVLWVVRSGMRWADLPERYGKYKSVHKRVCALGRGRVWDKLFADLVADHNNPYLMLDSTIVRAHQKAATGRKKGAPKTPALGRSRGGLSTKIHLLTNGLGEPMAFRLTAGQAAEYPEALPLLEAAGPRPGSPTRATTRRPSWPRSKVSEPSR